MSRPRKSRCIGAEPVATAFSPQGSSSPHAEAVELRLDELESIRLADLEGLYHDQAASKMGISRATFGRLIESARRKVADALLNARMLTFEEGPVTMPNRSDRDPSRRRRSHQGWRAVVARPRITVKTMPRSEQVTIRGQEKQP